MRDTPVQRYSMPTTAIRNFIPIQTAVPIAALKHCRNLNEFCTGNIKPTYTSLQLSSQCHAPDIASYSKFPSPTLRYTMVDVFVAKSGKAVRAAVTGAGDESNLMADTHCDATYRANLIKVMAKRAVSAA